MSAVRNGVEVVRSFHSGTALYVHLGERGEMMDEKVDDYALQTTDADAWAREFLKVVPDADEGLMTAWFASAIERGREAGYAAGEAAASTLLSPEQPRGG